MSEHPKLHGESTILVELQKSYGRIRYAPCNQLAMKFAEGLEQKTFLEADLKWIKTLGYTILIIGEDTKEFE